MPWKIPVERIVIAIGLTASLEACQLFEPRHAIPDLSGTYLANQAEIQADQATVDDILATFKRADGALRQGDLDGVMALYAASYKHHGFNQTTLRSMWKDLMREYRDFSTTHVFSRVQVNSQKSPPTAEITCTGSLWGVSKATGQRENIDSWFAEVHYLMLENGQWRMQGHAWESRLDKETRSERPPHPFF